MKTIPVLLAACALMFAAPVQAGIVIVNHDEWTLSSSAVNGPAFGVNIANYFAGGSGGSFLIYSQGFGLNDSGLINAISAAGHTVTVDTSIPFDLPTLSAYTGIFLGGDPYGYDPDVLTQYVNNGGNVYLAGGTGNFAEDFYFNPFLANFGFQYAPPYNFILGAFAPTTNHPIFAGIGELYYYWGNTVLLTGNSPYARLIAVHPETGEGMIGIYEVRGLGEIPEPATAALVGLGLLAAAWLRRR